MPGEWEPHAATWIAWPHNRTDWPGKFAPIPWVYAEIVRNLARVEQVNILVNDEACGRRPARVLVTADVLAQGLASSRALAAETSISGTFRPIAAGCVIPGQPSLNAMPAARTDAALGAVSWRFNAWAKYNDWKRDAPVSGAIACVAERQGLAA